MIPEDVQALMNQHHAENAAIWRPSFVKRLRRAIDEYDEAPKRTQVPGKLTRETAAEYLREAADELCRSLELQDRVGGR